MYSVVGISLVLLKSFKALVEAAPPSKLTSPLLSSLMFPFRSMELEEGCASQTGLLLHSKLTEKTGRVVKKEAPSAIKTPSSGLP